MRLVVERRVVGKDLPLERLQLAARFEAEFADEPCACGAVDVEGLRLSSGAVERQHQLAVDALAQWVRRGEPLELADELQVPAELQVDVKAILERGQA
jgi:hypothetical protein